MIIEKQWADKERKVKKYDDLTGLNTFVASLDYGSAVFFRKKLMHTHLKAQRCRRDIKITRLPVTEQKYFAVVSDPVWAHPDADTTNNADLCSTVITERF